MSKGAGDASDIISTPRLRLRCWVETHRDAFAAMHADPEVMLDYGGPISRRASDAKLEGYMASYREHGFARWAIETPNGDFLGYAGAMTRGPDHPLGLRDWCGTRGVLGTPRKPRRSR